MRQHWLHGCAAAGLGLAIVTGAEGRADACGGCFIVGQTATVVTDHRMILSVSPTASTLYDQIKYSGSPSSFAWVLPISGTVTVGLSADIVFSTLESQTATRILPPPQNCPGLPSNCPVPEVGFAGGPAAADAGASGVNVLVQQVVGPYETVQLQASDPQALETWLTQNGFNLPADVKPVVDEYVTEKFNFLAMKLLPTAGVQDMRPVRVTTMGANVALPLRMVAAGTGSTVGITLWILGEGRYEPQNFGTFTIGADELSWDWTQNSSNYTTLRAQKTTAGQGKVWEIESSVSITPETINQGIRRFYGPGQGPPGASGIADDYLPETNLDGSIKTTAIEARDEDITTLWAGISSSSARISRVRADLAHAALATDLVVGAAKDQSELSNLRQTTKELNQPLCPVYTNCQVTGQAPRDVAAAQSSGNRGNAAPNPGGSGGGETFTCGTSHERRAPAWAGGLLGIIALAELFRRRARRR